VLKKSIPFFVLVFFIFSCGENEKKENSLPEKQDIAILKMAKSYFSPLPHFDLNKVSESEKNKIELGKKLFYDTSLSGSGNVNCALCHSFNSYGTVNASVMPGDKGNISTRNPPTLLNSLLQYAFGWDAKYKTLEDQIGGMLLSKTEMGNADSISLIKKLISDKNYAELFDRAFPESKNSLSFLNVEIAVAYFIRSLITRSKFDNYLEGDLQALNTDEKLGIKSFVDNGCVPCHSTSIIGGSMPQKFALFGYYWDFTDSKNIDKGRYLITKKSQDEFVFKVSQLRNIAKTQPYFHDGSIQSLEEAVRIMGMSESNLSLEDKEVKNITAFLLSLTGKVPEHAFDKK
jgi:cytochrome c peroxidase